MAAKDAGSAVPFVGCWDTVPRRAATVQRLSDWLANDVLPFDPQARHGRDLALEWCKAQHLEPPALDHLDRVIRSAVHGFETRQQEAIHMRLSAASKAAIDRLLASEEPDASNDSEEVSVTPASALTFSQLKADLGKASRDNLLAGIARRQSIDAIGLVADVFTGVPTKFIDQFRQRCATESIRELCRHPAPIRYSMVAMFCWRRRQQLTDALIDMLLQLIHNLGTRAEKKIDKKQFAAFKKVRGKARLLFKLAEATVDQPEGVIKDVVYPVVSQNTLKELVSEFEAMGLDFEREVQETMRSSYGRHYRSMLAPVLDALTFRSNNTVHRPAIDALAVLQANRDSKRQYYEADEVPLEGVVPKKWRHIVIDIAKDGAERVNRIDYEVCVLRALRKRLRTKEIWVEGADRYRDPEQDLPADFDEKRDTYYDMLKAPKDAQVFIGQVKAAMRQWLKTFNDGVPNNPKVKLRKQGKNIIHLSPYTAQTEPSQYCGAQTRDRSALVGCGTDRHRQGSRPARQFQPLRSVLRRQPRGAGPCTATAPPVALPVWHRYQRRPETRRQPATERQFRGITLRQTPLRAKGGIARCHQRNRQWHLPNSSSGDLGQRHHRLCGRFQEVRRLRSESDDGMARALRRARHHDLLARRQELDLHLFADQALLIV
jgi:hypothetical protein